MSYIDLSPSDRETFIDLQLRGLRSPATIRETRRDYPGSPIARLAEQVRRALSPHERAVIEKFSGKRWAA